jgi:PAS domain S-box-containing protein
MDLWLEAYRRTWAHETPEEALAFYARIFDEAPAAIIVTQPNFAISDANVSAQRMLQRSVSALRGKLFHRYVAAADRIAFAAIAKQIISVPGSITRPLLMNSSDDSQVEVSLIACALRDAENNPEMIMLMLLDRGDQISSDIL